MAKIKFVKQKKQFRLYDVYRFATTGEMSNINGIVSYECNNAATTLVVKFEDATGTFVQGLPKMYFPKNELELKQAVRDINKRLGNCMTPGRKRRKICHTVTHH